MKRVRGGEEQVQVVRVVTAEDRRKRARAEAVVIEDSEVEDAEEKAEKVRGQPVVDWVAIAAATAVAAGALWFARR